jgi:hypothetical protein
MKQTFRLALSLCLVLLCSSVAFGQRAGARGGGHAAISAHSHQVLSRGSMAARPMARRAPNFNTRNLNGVPGLGFDYEHLAAVHRQARERGLNHRRRFVGPVYLLGGYPYYYPYDYDDEADYQPAPVGQRYGQDADDYPDQQAEPQPAPSPARASQTPLNATPEREIENFALVLKDGSQISAVAFTRQGDQVVYINGDGQRRYVAAAKVDANATTKVNEDRGTPLKFTL